MKAERWDRKSDITWCPWRVEVVQTPGEDHDVVDIQPASHHRGRVADTLE